MKAHRLCIIGDIYFPFYSCLVNSVKAGQKQTGRNLSKICCTWNSFPRAFPEMLWVFFCVSLRFGVCIFFVSCLFCLFAVFVLLPTMTTQRGMINCFLGCKVSRFSSCSALIRLLNVALWLFAFVWLKMSSLLQQLVVFQQGGSVPLCSASPVMLKMCQTFR